MALLLREADVRRLLTMPDTVTVLEQVFLAQADGQVVNQPRSRIELRAGVLHLLAAGVPSLGVLGFKTYTSFREGVRSVVVLFSASDGQLLAMIEADWLGRIRTGATSAVATKYLARPEATVVGMLGTGNQAIAQLMGMCAVRKITRVNVYSRTPEDCKLFCEDMARVFNLDVRPVASARQAVEYADIVITATTSAEPVLFGDWLQPGCHINAIGSNWARRRELDPSTLQHSYPIVTDSRTQAQVEAGDFIIPAEEGLFDWNKVYDLSEVVGGNGPQRESATDITLYKGIGIALEDVATAAHVFRLAQENHLGEQVRFL